MFCLWFFEQPKHSKFKLHRFNLSYRSWDSMPKMWATCWGPVPTWHIIMSIMPQCYNSSGPPKNNSKHTNAHKHRHTDTQTHRHTRTRTRTRNIIAECVKRQAPPGFLWCPQVLWFAILAKELQAAHLALPGRFRRDRLRNNVGKATL